MADTTAAQRQRAEELQLMMQGRGWQHVLALIFEQLRLAEWALGPDYPEATRFHNLGRRAMLLELLQILYRDAEVPSPLDQHYVQWLAHCTPPPLAPVAWEEPAPVLTP